MRRWPRPAFVLTAGLLALPAGAESSDVANRNLGINLEQVKKVHATLARKADPKPHGPTAAARPGAASVTATDPQIERIQVFGSIEEFDGPQQSALRTFADRLEAEQHLTPAKKVQLVLSALLGGPPPAIEPTPEERTLARAKSGGSMMATQRGTLQ